MKFVAAVLLLCVLVAAQSTSTAVGSQSTATGQGVTQGGPLLGSAAVITVTTKDAAGNPVTTGGADVQVNVEGPTSDLTASTNDNGDGTYTITYTPQQAGFYIVNIQVEGTEVIDGPFDLDIESTCAAPSCSAPAGCFLDTPSYDNAGCQLNCGTLNCSHSPEGSPCGTILGITCDESQGLVCKYENGSLSPPAGSADEGGICYTADEHAEGQTCNASAFECAPWLTCITPPGADATVCEECPFYDCVPPPDTCPAGTTLITPLDASSGCPQCQCCADATGSCLLECGDSLPSCPSDMTCVTDNTAGAGSFCQPRGCKAGNKICADGSTVQRNPANNCSFDPCPQVCRPDGKPCGKGLRCDPTCNRTKTTTIFTCKPAGILTRPPPYPMCFTAKLNQKCGGKTGAQCATGLVCSGSTDKKFGKCKKALAKAGEHCGGNMLNPPQCAPGLTCILQIPADLGGTCQALAKKGQHCGGFTQNPKQCAPGLVCVLGKIADIGGTCQLPPKKARKGQKCGGVKNIQCVSPYECRSKKKNGQTTCQVRCPALPCPFLPSGCTWVNPLLNKQGCPRTCGSQVCPNTPQEIGFPQGDGGAKDRSQP